MRTGSSDPLGLRIPSAVGDPLRDAQRTPEEQAAFEEANPDIMKRALLNLEAAGFTPTTDLNENDIVQTFNEDNEIVFWHIGPDGALTEVDENGKPTSGSGGGGTGRAAPNRQSIGIDERTGQGVSFDPATGEFTCCARRILARPPPETTG